MLHPNDIQPKPADADPIIREAEPKRNTCSPTPNHQAIKAMPEKVTIDKKNGIIMVRSVGNVTFEDISSSREKIFELHRKTGFDKVLVDARKLQSFITIGEAYSFSDSIGKDPRSRVMKWAFIPSKKTLEQARFLETTSRNRGLHVMLHDSIDSALKWLKEEAT